MTSLLNFIKIYQLVQKFIGGKTHRHEGDLISLLFYSFKKASRLTTSTCCEKKASRT
jgi:hypothetical protein